MLRLTTDLIKPQPLDMETIAGWVNSGYQGTWVTLNSSNKLVRTTVQAASGITPAWAVWTESKYKKESDGAGYTPDATQTLKLTVLIGHYRALTDQYDTDGGAPAIGSYLGASTSGKLTVISGAPPAKAVAQCIKVAAAYDVRGVSYTMIEYETI